MQSLKNALVLAVSCTALVTLANAALVITTDDIIDNTYSFSISFDDLVDNTKFENALYSSTNIYGATNEKPGESSERRFVVPVTGTFEASFVIAFDFTQAGYTIADFTIRDTLFISNTTNGTTITGMSSWTTGLANSGTQIRTVLAPGGAGGQESRGTTFWTIPEAETQSIIYYVVTFAGTNPGRTLGTNTQWNRAGGQYNTTTFLVNFDLVPVPEPSTYAILIGIISTSATLFWRRRTRR
ncbi:MAG: PEP-CTERM sorting domain-containing protein [Opitutaceae bacterium]|jgi:hypothetical protein|nr:PEP-CTERM sorting domain-containing protein [Opitutaceae bacterium]